MAHCTINTLTMHSLYTHYALTVGMENTFMAHGFDMQDPWNSNKGACVTNPGLMKGYDCTTPWYGYCAILCHTVPYCATLHCHPLFAASHSMSHTPQYASN
jgi:hypothetical protein